MSSQTGRVLLSHGAGGRLARYAQVIFVLVAAVGGAFFGYFACGGYAWHRHTFLFANAALSLVAAALAVGSWLSRTLLFLAIWPVYWLGQALAAPLYPAAPASWAEYWRGVVVTLQYGPC
jgi:hypothetical protein